MTAYIKYPVPRFYIDYEFQDVGYQCHVPQALNVAGDPVIPAPDARSVPDQLSDDDTRTIVLTDQFNAVCPGTIETPVVAHMLETGDLDRTEQANLQPIARLGLPEEIASVVLFLSSPAASFVIGTPIPVVGGYTAR